ncbi:MAG: signal peptidase I [Lachnospiraceae bacterium]|nr:signal peptidase I [Lachnospiraceae bacterium]
MSSYYSYSDSFRQNQKRQLREKIIFYSVGVIASILLAFVLVRFVGFGITMKGDSMKETIQNGQHLIGVRFTNAKQNDIIVFRNGDEDNSYYIKRVIAVPGDTVLISDEQILVNDKAVEQKGEEPIISAGLASKPITLKENQYFVLGDNYNNSVDSRVASVGNVNKDDIVGRIIFKLW